MKKVLTFLSVITIAFGLATPANAWYRNYGYGGGCWNCGYNGGAAAGAAIAGLAIGALAGAAIANSQPYYGGYYYAPPPRVYYPAPVYYYPNYYYGW